MKKYIVSVSLLVTFIAVSFFALYRDANGAVKRIIPEVYEVFAKVVTGGDDIRIYKITDGDATCYVSYFNGSSGNLKTLQHNLSCVK